MMIDNSMESAIQTVTGPFGQRIARATEGIEIPWWFAGSEQFHQEEETPPFSFFWPKKVFLFFS